MLCKYYTNDFCSMIKSCYARFYIRKIGIPKKSCYGKSCYVFIKSCYLCIYHVVGRLEAISSSTDEEKNEGSLNVWLMPDNWMEDPWTRVCTYHITYTKYICIESLSTYFEKYLLPQFVSQGSFSQLSSQ